MEQHTNLLGQPIGCPLASWKPPAPPPHQIMEGRFCRLAPLDPEQHARSLFEAFSVDTEGRMWTYLPYGPFESLENYQAWVEQVHGQEDPLFFVVLEVETNKPIGVASYLRITPLSGSIEVGHLAYSPRMQRTAAATEAMYLMMEKAFALGYRRYEWKCDALNRPSMMAAQRLGFTFEGIFRQATVVKGRNRDTAWFSILDHEWPALNEAFQTWLHPTNFDAQGKQKTRLTHLTAQKTSKERGHSCPPTG